MAYKFMHIGIVWKNQNKHEQIKAALGQATDWVFYAGCNWIVYSNVSISDWAIHLRSVINSEDSLFICEICNITESDGWMPPWVWEWVRKPRLIY
jgi:hypothetical protein